MQTTHIAKMYGIPDENGDVYMPGCFNGSLKKDLKLVDHTDTVIGDAKLLEPSELSTDIANKENNIIRLALIKNGIDPEDIQFLVANITRVSTTNDLFEHYILNAGTPNEKRIISIEKDIKIDYINDETGGVKVNASRRWY